MTHEIFKLLPHQRVISKHANNEEIFDLYPCGLFKNNLLMENIELVELQPHSQYRPHYHKNSSAVIYIISGTGMLLLSNSLIEYKQETRFTIPAGMTHGFQTKTRTLFLSIQSPPIIHPVNGHIDLHYETGDVK